MEQRDQDFKLLEHYIAFSAEVLRVSLLAIGAIGALYTIKIADSPAELGATTVKCSFGLSLTAFGIAIACSLAHRYWATDFMACQVALDRLRSSPPSYKTTQQIEEEIKCNTAARRTASRWSKCTIWTGPLFLAAGAASLAFAFGVIVMNRG
jgi:hypothetical protein